MITKIIIETNSDLWLLKMLDTNKCDYLNQMFYAHELNG